MELMVAVQAAPVPRASVTLHAEPAFALTVWAAPVTAVSTKENGCVAIASVPAVSVIVACSAFATPAVSGSISAVTAAAARAILSVRMADLSAPDPDS
ncbi:MAG: hypothetical protein AUG44_25295 [Actinobacteria bacterium 13_1_20CM_3_71_11]|nr:MAG: hypothetical protein AUG44_25295 [Actinobacteria bacterium 13_1_20CM_3_71_11]